MLVLDSGFSLLAGLRIPKPRITFHLPCSLFHALVTFINSAFKIESVSRLRENNSILMTHFLWEAVFPLKSYIDDHININVKLIPLISLRRLRSSTVIRRDSPLFVAEMTDVKQESEFLVMTGIVVHPEVPELNSL